jgi:hypothetical protein
MIYIVDTNVGHFIYRGKTPLKNDVLKREIRKSLNGEESTVHRVGEESPDHQTELTRTESK